MRTKLIAAIAVLCLFLMGNMAKAQAVANLSPVDAKISIDQNVPLSQFYEADLKNFRFKDEVSANKELKRYDKKHTELILDIEAQKLRIKLLFDHPEVQGWTLSDWTAYLENEKEE